MKLAIWSIFSGMVYIFTMPPLRPPSTFSEHWPCFWQYLLSWKVTQKCWCKIWVIIIPKNAKFLVWYFFVNDKKASTYDHFFNLWKPYWPPCPTVQWVMMLIMFSELSLSLSAILLILPTCTSQYFGILLSTPGNSRYFKVPLCTFSNLEVLWGISSFMYFKVLLYTLRYF